MKQDEEKGVLGMQDKMTPGYQEGQARREGWRGWAGGGRAGEQPSTALAPSHHPIIMIIRSSDHHDQHDHPSSKEGLENLRTGMIEELSP